MIDKTVEKLKMLSKSQGTVVHNETFTVIAEFYQIQLEILLVVDALKFVYFKKFGGTILFLLLLEIFGY